MYYLLLYRTDDPAYRAVIVDHLNTAISMDPFSANTRLLLAQYELVFGNLSAAQASVCKKSLDIDPGNFGAWIFLAKTYQLQNNRDALVQALKKSNYTTV